jgi:hypothetical protein
MKVTTTSTKVTTTSTKGCWLSTIVRSGNILPCQYVAIIRDIPSLVPFNIPSALSISSYPTKILSGLLFSMWCLVHCNLSDFTNSRWHVWIEVYPTSPTLFLMLPSIFLIIYCSGKQIPPPARNWIWAIEVKLAVDTAAQIFVVLCRVEWFIESGF